MLVACRPGHFHHWSAKVVSFCYLPVLSVSCLHQIVAFFLPTFCPFVIVQQRLPFFSHLPVLSLFCMHMFVFFFPCHLHHCSAKVVSICYLPVLSVFCLHHPVAFLPVHCFCPHFFSTMSHEFHSKVFTRYLRVPFAHMVLYGHLPISLICNSVRAYRGSPLSAYRVIPCMT